MKRRNSGKLLCLLLSCLLGTGALAACTGPEPGPSESEQPTAGPTDDPVPDETLSYQPGNRFDYPNSKIKAFDYNGVKLANTSRFRQEFNYAMEYLLSVPNDDLLKVMRMREGKDVEGSRLMGGWYDGGLWVAATFGQYVSALARAYALTDDARYRDKAVQLMDGWADCISEDGFFYFSPDRATNSTHYTYDKVVLMCVDVYTYIGGEAGERALGYLKTATDFAEGYLGRSRINAGPDGPHSGQSAEGGNSDIEWYTLSENLYRAYLATGDKRYEAFADVWNYPHFWNALASGDASVWSNVHAYSHTNSVGGAALKYMVQGDEASYRAITGFYEAYRKGELYPNGLYGGAERLVGGRTDRTSQINASSDASAEVPCDTWAGLKISRYLTGVTGSAAYSDWTEKLLYNGVLAPLRLKDTEFKRGNTFYYASYQKEAEKKYYGDAWPCCSGTYFLNLCDVANELYFYDDDALYCANYAASQVEALYHGRRAVVTQSEDLTANGRASFTVTCTDRVDFDLKLRKPGWCASYRVQKNGADVEASEENGWIVVEGAFANGDRVTVDFGLPLTLESVEPGNESMMMAMCGPVYLVARDADTSTIRIEEGKTLGDYVTGRSGESYIVQDAVGTRFVFQPFYALEEGARYAGNLALKRPL